MRGSPRTSSRNTDANLGCSFVDTTIVFVVPEIEGGGGSPLGQLKGLADENVLIVATPNGSYAQDD